MNHENDGDVHTVDPWATRTSPVRPAFPRPFDVACLLGALAGRVSRASGRGSGGVMPGRVVLALVPDALRRLGAGRRVLVVSGTNGKTTTTRVLAAALSSQGGVLTNSDGSNQASGLVTTLLRGRSDRRVPVVLEVDEISLPGVIAQVEPAVAVLLNLSRDQLDRTGEVAAHVSRWSRALRTAERTTIVANADDPLVVAAVVGARPQLEQVVWVGAGQPWRDDAARCPVCGSAWEGEGTSWRCTSCGLHRPAAEWSVEGDSIAGPHEPLQRAELQLPGHANVANAAMAAAAAATLGVSLEQSLREMRGVTDVEGRYGVAEHDGARVRLLLAKNPAGWAEALTHLDATTPVVLAVNARTADGTDPSWLWDVPFEQLRGRRVVVSGERAADLSVRLLYGGVEHTCVAQPLDAVGRAAGADQWDVLANYTAFQAVRRQLRQEAA